MDAFCLVSGDRRRWLLLGAVALLLLLQPVSASRADTTRPLSVSKMTIIANYPNGGCSGLAVFRFSTVPGASDYTATMHSVYYPGQPFYNDSSSYYDDGGGDPAFATPPGTHQWAGSSYSQGTGPCTYQIDQEWTVTDALVHFPNPSVSGKVTDADGSPLAGVTVKVTGPESGSATTRSDGTYSAGPFHTSGSYTVTTTDGNLCVTGKSPCQSSTDVSLPPSATDVNFQRPDRTRLSGHVNGIDGHPGEAGLTVTATGPMTRTTTTGPDGAYEMLVDPGTYTVTPSGKDGEFSPAATTVDATAGPATADFQVGFRVQGTVSQVLCAAGCSGPAKDVTVKAEDKAGGVGGETTSADDGTWSLLLGPGDYTLTPSTAENELFDPETRDVAVHGKVADQDFKRCADVPETAARARRANKLGDVCTPDTLEWHMPERLDGKSVDTWDKLDGLPSRKFINPKDWTVGLYMAKGDRRVTCNNLVRYKWEVDEKRLPKGAKVVSAPKAVKGDGCAATMRVSAQGKYHLTAAREEKVKGKWKKVGGKIPRAVKVKDWLIVAMGDSNGSGEGNWPFFYRRCARSDASYQFTTARRVEDDDPHSSVTFIFASCSGASVAHLIDRKYAGTVPDDAHKLPEQLDQIGYLLDPIKQLGDTQKEARQPDAALISIGVNNLGFGTLLSYCVELAALGDACQDKPAKVRSDGAGGLAAIHLALRGKTLRAHLNDLQRMLPTRYHELATALKRPIARVDSGLGDIKPNRIFMSHYPNFTRGTDGNTCDTRLTGSVPQWGPDTWGWLGKAGDTLNDTIDAASGRYGWTAVPVSDEPFVHHGYCATPSLFVSVANATANGDSTGPFHPGFEAHNINAAATYRQLCNKLYGRADCHD